jgi:Cys-tRNA(Pro) deacylase
MTVLEIDAELLSVSPMMQGDLPAELAGSHDAIRKVTRWIDDYLCKPHPELGRLGPVCPFVPTALEKNTFFMRVFEDNDFDEATIVDILLREKQRFLELEPQSGPDAQFKTILILFPHVQAERANELMDMAQETLKHQFVPDGLMVGEFHPGPPQKAGLWNRDFRPLGCPVPLIAIRHMVPTDILFLKDEHSLVSAYLSRFADAVPRKFASLIVDAAEKFGFDLPASLQRDVPEAAMAHSEATVKTSQTLVYELERKRIPYKVHRHAMCKIEIHNPVDFANALGYPVERITKALFIRDRKREHYFIITTPAMKRLDLKALAKTLDVGRLEFASKEELAERVGYPPTAVTPIGVTGVTSVVDACLLEQETILTGAGVLRMEIEIAPQDLCNLTKAQVLDL